MTRLPVPPLPPAPDLSFEDALWKSGVLRVAGLDEAGRGALAGPVFAAAVVLPTRLDIAQQLDGVRDSKQMTARQRSQAAGLIKKHAAGWGVGSASTSEIERLGIAPAVRLAMRRALDVLPAQAQYLLIDYLELPEVATPQIALIKGDARVLSIAAASILAKTARDALMEMMERDYPGYGFGTHFGYGTAAHLEAIQRLGASPIHRRNFRPMRQQ